MYLIRSHGFVLIQDSQKVLNLIFCYNLLLFILPVPAFAVCDLAIVAVAPASED